MPLPIKVQEGESSKVIGNVSRLKTNLNGGGSCLWVPESEVRLLSKTIIEDGTYTASDEGYYGYSQVIVSGVGSQVMGQVGPKTITQNGTYRAEDDGLYGYSEVTVNVPTSSGVISGTDVDPVTGNTEPATISTDDDGYIVKTTVADSIEIATPPTTTTYQDGTTIDFSGISVVAHKSSGEIWSNSRYPTGEVPFGELIFDPIVANIDESVEPRKTSPLISGEIAFDSYGYASSSTGWTHYYRAPYFTLVKRGSFLGKIYASKNPDDKGYFDPNGDTRYHGIEEISLDSVYTVSTVSGDQTVYYKYVGDYWSSNITGMYPFTNSNSGEDRIAWTMVYGDLIEGGQPISVKWKRFNDEKILETSFSITVISIPVNGGGGTGGGGGTSYDITQ